MFTTGAAKSARGTKEERTRGIAAHSGREGSGEGNEGQGARGTGGRAGETVGCRESYSLFSYTALFVRSDLK